MNLVATFHTPQPIVEKKSALFICQIRNWIGAGDHLIDENRNGRLECGILKIQRLFVSADCEMVLQRGHDVLHKDLLILLCHDALAADASIGQG